METNRKSGRKKTLLELIDAPIEDIAIVIKNLYPAEKQLLFKRFGKNLKENNVDGLTKKERARINYIINSKIRAKLNCKATVCSLYTLLDCTKEELDAVIRFLNEEDLRLLKTKYGEDLSGNVVAKLSRQDNQALMSNVFIKIRKYIQKYRETIKSLGNDTDIKSVKFSVGRTGKKLEEYIGCNYEELITHINQLNPKHIELLQKRFGQQFDEASNSALSTNEKNIIRQVIIPKLRRMAQDETVNKTPYDLFNCTKEEFFTILPYLLEEDIELINKKFGTERKRPDPQRHSPARCRTRFRSRFSRRRERPASQMFSSGTAPRWPPTFCEPLRPTSRPMSAESDPSPQ